MSHTSAARPRVRTRIGLAMTAVIGLLSMVFAPAAFAATDATYNNVYTGGHAVWMNGAQHGTSVFTLDLAAGGTVRAYCVDLGVPINAGDTYEIQQLAGQIVSPAKVLWILQHSYPVLNLNQLSTASGVAPMTTAIAVAGTQAAIWHYTDGQTLDTNKNSDGVRALYNYLIGDANVGASSEAAPTLSITPATEVTSGGRVGPFTVNFSGSGTVDLSVNPAFAIYDAAADGTAVTTGSNGDEVWVDVPVGTAPGDVTVTATGSASVSGGWALVSPDRPTQVQKLAYAGVRTLTASATATITVTPSPTPTDPGTTPPATTPPPTSTPPNPEPGTTTPVSTPSTTQPGLADTGAGSSSTLALAGVAALLLGAGAMVMGSTRRVGRRH